MRRLLPIAATAALVAGCATAPSERVCLAQVEYSRETQARALAELEALPPGSVLAQMMDDYGDLRARERAACGR